MDKAQLKVIVDALFGAAKLAAKGRLVVTTFLNLAQSWIDQQLEQVAAEMSKQ